MSSSRWKRFAFFDRHSITIPNEVFEDLIPAIKSSGSINNNNNNIGNNAASDGQQTDTVTTTTTNDNNDATAAAVTAKANVKRSLRTVTIAGQEVSAENDIVSTILTTAALPLLSKPVVGLLANNNNNNNTTTTNVQSQTSSQTQATSSSALDAMWMSLTACSPLDGNNNYLNTVELPNQGQQIYSSQQQQQQQAKTTTTTSSKLETTTSTTAVDGLVLCFVTSHNTQLVHCFDLTVRCNPPRKQNQNQNQQIDGVTTGTGTTGSTAVATKRLSNSTIPLPSEDMDGWRGYFAPFFPQLVSIASSNTTGDTSSSSVVAASPSIVSMASCRCYDRHRPLHVACITNQHIVIWEDPHLHLLYRRPLSTSSVTITPPVDAIIYTTVQTTSQQQTSTSSQQQQSQSQSQSWNTSSGQYRVVDIIPGIVAIGTSSGTVLVYVYTCTSTDTTTTSRTTNSTTTNRKYLRPYLRIPSPPGTNGTIEVISIKLIQVNDRKVNAFVSYNRRSSTGTIYNNNLNMMLTTATSTTTTGNTTTNPNQSTVGICCYEIPLSSTAMAYTQSASIPNMISGPSARHDLDGRYVTSSNLVDTTSSSTGMSRDVSNNDTVSTTDKMRLIVARPDGLYSYSKSERTGVAPIDGNKLAMCIIPPPVIRGDKKRRDVTDVEDDIGIGSGYVLVASTDLKSNRDTVDIYDITNNLVAFHLLLSPGHRAVCAAATVTVQPSSTINSTTGRTGRSHIGNNSSSGGQSSAIVLTSGGSLVTFTEKRTYEKINLLIQKNLYSAAIVVAYADQSYDASEITSLYQNYAEHLYQKGDYAGAIDQYIQTIGSLESSHVIFRYLDAPKIPLLVKYLEQLRSISLATPMHNDLLRTCYLKLNDTEAAEAISLTTASSPSSLTSSSTKSKGNNVSIAMASVLSNLSLNPKESLATVCSLEAHQAVEIMMIHGASFARAFPRETAGVILSLCLGTFSPKALSDVSIVNNPTALYKLLQYNSTSTTTSIGDQPMTCEPYPAHMFLPRAFVEHPKMLRLVLAHCNRSKCPLTPALRRTLLELTLSEWNRAKRSGDTETEKLRHKEAIAALTDSHCRDIGDYDALVIVQLAGFEEGELLLYERLQMTPLVLKRYAAEGSEKSRRRMLAMCQADPEILADVLSHFVAMANAKLSKVAAATADNNGNDADDGFDNDESEEIMEHIQECLALAKRQGVLPPVRIARILAGEHPGQFSTDRMQFNSHVRSGKNSKNHHGVPLSVALDYVGTILDESRSEISRLKGEVEEYNNLCNAMENEINMLLRVSGDLPQQDSTINDTVNTNTDGATSTSSDAMTTLLNRLNVDDLYYQIRASDDVDKFADRVIVSDAREAFWREMNQTEDTFETVSKFFAKGIVN